MKNFEHRLLEKFPGKTSFTNKEILAAAGTLAVDVKIAYKYINSRVRISRGVYSIEEGSSVKAPSTPRLPKVIAKTIGLAPKATATEAPEQRTADCVASAIDDSVFIPEKDPFFIPWGHFKDVKEVMSYGGFFPILIPGLSGNGKTLMVEQAAAAAGREFIRFQISPETDEDDLLGGFRLVNGETVFQKGPVIKAMEHGAVLLVDEVDRGSNKIMCLQGVLEGKPVLIKKTGEIIHPAPGFTIVATANTKGRGSDDGRYSAATIIDDAFLERFVATLEQPYPGKGTEHRIVTSQMKRFGLEDNKFFVNKLIAWSDIIRKTYEDDGLDEQISTRRLCHIVNAFAVFRSEEKAIGMCIARFDTETKAAFLDLYSKIGDGSITPVEDVPSAPATKDDGNIPF